MKKMTRAKQPTNDLLPRHFGQSCTSSRGTYVRFEKAGRLFRVDPRNPTNSVELTGSRDASLVMDHKMWMPGVSRWAYNQLQGSKIRKLGPEIAVEESVEPMLGELAVPQIQASKPMPQREIFSKQCGIVLVVLVLQSESRDLKQADVFHIDATGKAVRKSFSTAQRHTYERLVADRYWHHGMLGEGRFASVRDALASEMVSVKKAA